MFMGTLESFRLIIGIDTFHLTSYNPPYLMPLKHLHSRTPQTSHKTFVSALQRLVQIIQSYIIHRISVANKGRWFSYRLLYTFSAYSIASFCAEYKGLDTSERVRIKSVIEEL